MVRSWTLAAIAGGLAACSSIDAMAAEPMPTETFKIRPAAKMRTRARALTLIPKDVTAVRA
jgi:hypothetical protein